jgi:hypothetical protein
MPNIGANDAHTNGQFILRVFNKPLRSETDHMKVLGMEQGKQLYGFVRMNVYINHMRWMRILLSVLENRKYNSKQIHTLFL